MKTERLTTCDTYRDDLLRLACGEVPEPSAELAAHLRVCAACREELEASEEVLGSLRSALEPEPLSPTLTARIHARIEAVVARSHRALAVWLRVGCTAAAAVLLASVLWPQKSVPLPNVTPVAAVELTAQDTAEVAAAYALLGWDSVTDDVIKELGERVQGVAQKVETRSNAPQTLPWGVEDNWDVPSAQSGRSAASVERVV